MAKQKFGLGRGLDSLIPGASDVMSVQQTTQVDPEALTQVSIESIMPNPRQPRRIFREDDPRLLELSSSIKEHGLLQPIVVMKLDSGADSNKAKAQQAASAWLDDEPEAVSSTHSAPGVQYQIIAGERRWRASRLAGLTRVPVVIKDVNPQQMLELALIENIQRADLNPVEEALAYQSLVMDYGLTQEQVAHQVGKDRSTVTNAIRLLQLAPKVREALVNMPDNFTEGHARALINIPREEDQVHAMEQIVAERLTVRQTEELASRLKEPIDEQKALQSISETAPREPEIDETRHSLSRRTDGQS